ncbi:hypothetical protein PF005_g31099 [Phytophthora fragariae]|uniref:Uncharacterized protein n=1 Tax=Phytophthora fragariae TaxID=53985 RepID=A0A6A4AXQ9_9STRA|nr:hypothetical protein PF003_g12688 [Phytophthora fragariae]KAE8916707.1 hypothetical protein PF009_g32970 [Phytophthora fragariae]KAE8952826.1 hypothetical protein PF011_g32587 [Phytophthora fragariae]KAE9054260.1 hypothetical protein PF010_g32612 [Phytophthora fragariae]KAE9054882.1 hypothetical protein PF007_g32498 [Phytophthora fragariae]
MVVVMPVLTVAPCTAIESTKLILKVGTVDCGGALFASSGDLVRTYLKYDKAEGLMAVLSWTPNATAG